MTGPETRKGESPKAMMQAALDKEIFCARVIENQEVLFRTAKAILRNDEDAEDAVQETFIKAYDHIDELLSGKIESTKAWLMRIAVNTCKDTLRSSWMRHIDNRQEIEALPLSIASRAEERLALTQAIMALAPKHREIVLLYYYQDMTAAETAAALGIREDAVYQRLRRARQQLKKELEEQ